VFTRRFSTWLFRSSPSSPNTRTLHNGSSVPALDLTLFPSFRHIPIFRNTCRICVSVRPRRLDLTLDVAEEVADEGAPGRGRVVRGAPSPCRPYALSGLLLDDALLGSWPVTMTTSSGPGHLRTLPVGPFLPLRTSFVAVSLAGRCSTLRATRRSSRQFATSETETQNRLLRPELFHS